MKTSVIANGTPITEDLSEAHIKAMNRVMPKFGFVTRNSRLYRNTSGSAPIVIALPRDNMSTIITKVQALGGGANIVVVESKRFKVFQITEITSTEHGVDNSAKEMSQSLSQSVGMFLLSISRQGHGPSRRMTFANRDFDAEFMDENRSFQIA